MLKRINRQGFIIVTWACEGEQGISIYLKTWPLNNPAVGIVVAEEIIIPSLVL